MPVSPPSQHRVHLGLMLREAREALDLSQAKVGELIARPQSWVNKIETAQVQRIKTKDLERLIEALGIKKVAADRLRSYARSPYSSRGAWTYPADTVLFKSELQAELVAKVIISVQFSAHDGLTHCERYMTRQFHLWKHKDVRAAVKARSDRQRAVLFSDDPPEFTMILAEGALYQDMGDPDAIIEQLKFLLHLQEYSHITILVLPFGAHVPALTFSFTVMQFGSMARPDYAMIEHLYGATIFDEENRVRDYTRLAALVRDGALNQIDSITCIGEAIDHHQNKLKDM